MKVSEYFNLNKSQHELDFVDIDLAKDNPLFIDPFFISTRIDPLSIDVDTTIKSFFQYVIDLIKSGNETLAKNLLSHLNEPNETCLGMSKGEPKGRGIARQNAEWIYDSLVQSEAVKTGLVENLEDSVLFIEGIGPDKISDATTNIIRDHLLKYTISQCELWNIPLSQSVPSDFYWDSVNKIWNQGFYRRLVVDNKPILLVPKIIVTFYQDFVPQKYYQHFVLNYLQSEHVRTLSSLVQFRKDHTPYVTKKDVKANESPYSKEYLANFTRTNPGIFANFKTSTANAVSPISNNKFSDINVVEVVDYLKNELSSISPGGADASRYHSLMKGILELIFYPNLVNPKKEREINDGRKRIDISFDNSATNGYFYKLHDIHKIISRYIFIECKNYSEDPTNPELDQLSGRLSVNTGMMGILMCRTVTDPITMTKRCADLWNQKKELILVFTDQDIIRILDLIKANSFDESIFFEKQREVILS